MKDVWSGKPGPCMGILSHQVYIGGARVTPPMQQQGQCPPPQTVHDIAKEFYFDGLEIALVGVTKLKFGVLFPLQSELAFSPSAHSAFLEQH